MPVNQAVIGALLARPNPPEDQCIISNEALKIIERQMAVVGLAAQIASPTGVSTPVTNNVGQQALTLAQSLQAAIQELQANKIQRRVVVSNGGVSAGDSNTPFTFDPPMPSTNYHVSSVEFTTGPGHTVIPTWRTRITTKTTSGFTLLLDDVPADAVITVVIDETKSIL